MVNIVFPYYFFGSPDSIDTDVLLEHPEMTGTSSDKELVRELKENNPAIKHWNLSLIKVQEKKIVTTMQRRGSPDAVHNSLFYTYHYHDQRYTLPLALPVKRHRLLAVQGCIRNLLAILASTNYKRFYKGSVSPVLKEGDWEKELQLLGQLDFHQPFFSDPERNLGLCKSLAFDLGQTISLVRGKECYTKAEVIKDHPELKEAIYRQPADIHRCFHQKITELNKEITAMKISQTAPFIISCAGETVNTRFGTVIS